jgi:tetratricopeptide (TPR) repeat protein
MSDETRHDHLLARAGDRIAHGDLDHAIEVLRQLLAEDPDHGPAHALLAVCLIDKKLLGPAEIEAQAALDCDPEEPLAHIARGLVFEAERRFDAAAEHFERAIELAPDWSNGYLRMAHLESLRGRPYRELLDRALALDPGDADVLAAISEECSRRNDVDQAERFATQALQSDPESHDALLAMGWIRLRRGDLAGAREHAAMALSQQADSGRALHLLIAIKARRNPFLGFWFRWNLWMSSMGDRRSIAILVAGYLIYRLATALAEDLGRDDIASILQIVWFAFVVYTWIAPSVFARMLQREQKSTRLREDY